MQDQSTTIEQHLCQIADMLLLNGTLTDCPGFIHGKTGMAIFFFHYARYRRFWVISVGDAGLFRQPMS